MNKIPASVMIFTLNEEINLPYCLKSLEDFDDVIIVDSYSTDQTVKISEDWGARVFQNKFEGFGKQRNWAFEHTDPKNEWVLILDADECVMPQLSNEIKEVLAKGTGNTVAYRIKRRFHMWGRWLKHSSHYPTWVVRLVKYSKVSYINRGHAETQECDGEIGELEYDLIDENRKGIREWYERQNHYSTQEARYEMTESAQEISLSFKVLRDPLKCRQLIKQLSWKMPFRPLFYFLYSYILKGGFLEGREGFMFCCMKATYYGMITVKKYEMRKGE